MADLHVTNGDGAGNILKRCGVAGDVLPWRDPMHHGPFPAGLSRTDLSRVRATYLAGPSAADQTAFQGRDAQLCAAPDYDRVVLWFEHDLLDQLQVLQILDWLGDLDLDTARLEMICIDRFPGIEPFRGLGQLDDAQMAALLGERRPVLPEAIALAQAGWSAFRSGDPRDLLDFVQGDLRHLPFLRASLLRHFEEYPCASTGLTRTEMQLLSLVAKGVNAPADLFVQNMVDETALFIGDLPTFAHIAQLCDASLLRCSAGQFQMPPRDGSSPGAFRGQRLYLADRAEAILARGADAFGQIDRDQWLGGVHLRSDRPMWTWDAEDAKFLERIRG